MTTRKASLSKRFLAALVDTVLTSLVSRIPIVGGIIGLIYFLSKDVLMFSLTRDPRWKNMSIGKSFMEIKVVKMNGGDITLADSVKRNITLSLGSIIAMAPDGRIVGSTVALASTMLETILLLVDPEGRRLGDRLAGTRVVEAESYRT